MLMARIFDRIVVRTGTNLSKLQLVQNRWLTSNVKADRGNAATTALGYETCKYFAKDAHVLAHCLINEPYQKHTHPYQGISFILAPGPRQVSICANSKDKRMELAITRRWDIVCG